MKLELNAVKGKYGSVRPHDVSLTLWRLTLFCGSFLLLGIALLNVFGEPRLDRSWPLYVTIGFTIWLVVYFVSTYKFFKTFYLLTTTYITCLAVFHLGHIIAHSVGWFSVPNLITGGMAAYFERAGWYCLLALGALGIGFSISLPRKKNIVSGSGGSRGVSENTLQAAFWIGVGLLVASILSLVFLTLSIGNILAFSRVQIFRGIGDTRGFGFFLNVVPSAAVLLVIGATTFRKKLFAYTVATLVLLFLLFLGFRSSALFAAFVGAVVWVKIGRRIPLFVLGSAIVFVLVAIPTVRYLRALGPYEDISGTQVIKSIQEAETQEVVSELGGVSGIMAHVLKWVPADDPYRYGQSYWQAFIDAIPNLGLRPEESGRSELKRQGFVNSESLRNMSPSDWFTYKSNRWMFATGGGAGFSTIAEPYLNFGLPGVLGYFLVLGLLLGKLEQVDLCTHPKTLIFSSAMFWPLLKTVRNVFGVFLKPLAFILLSIFIWKVCTFWKAKKK